MGNFRFYRRVSIFPGTVGQPVEVGAEPDGWDARRARDCSAAREFARRSESPAPASTIRRTADTIRGRTPRTSSSRFRIVSRRQRTGSRR